MDGNKNQSQFGWIKLFETASKTYFDKDYATIGEGGLIPFMSFLGEGFPDSQFVITGLGAPDSNAHSIDENIDILYLKKLLCCLIDLFSNISKSNSD